MLRAQRMSPRLGSAASPVSEERGRERPAAGRASARCHRDVHWAPSSESRLLLALLRAPDPWLRSGQPFSPFGDFNMWGAQ